MTNLVFNYFSLGLRLREIMLGTNASCDIMSEHVIKKSREKIELANRAQKKISKSLKKYKGPQISEEKELEELKGILLAQQELLGVREDVPTTIEGILTYSEELQERIDVYIKENQADPNIQKSTVFLRHPESEKVCISSHMILGNLKSILANIINSGNKTILKSKTQMGESMSQDIKCTEVFLEASQDVMRDIDGTPELNIRPIRFNRMGQTISALAASEQLPAGTTFDMVLRVRKESTLNNLETLEFLFGHGKALGLGAYRNSHSYGSYDFKLEELKNYEEVIIGSEDGWK